MTSHDLVIRGGDVVDGTGAAARAADVGVDERTHRRGGRDCRPRRGARSTRTARSSRPGFVDIHTHYDGQATWDEPHVTPSTAARRDHGGHGQLRRRLCAGAARRPRPADRADGRRRGHSRRGAARRAVVGLGDVPAVSRLSVAAPVRHRHRSAAAARRVARLRDGRARRESRAGDRRRHRADARAGARGGRRRRDRLLDVAHAESSQQQRRADAVADGRGRRAGRHRDGPEGCRPRRARVDLRFRRSRRRVQHRRTDGRGERSPHLDLVGAGIVAERLEEDARSNSEQRRRRTRDARPGCAAADRHRARSVDDVESVADAAVVYGDREGCRSPSGSRRLQIPR